MKTNIVTVLVGARRLALGCAALVLAGCATGNHKVEPIDLAVAPAELAESRLLDVGLIEFSPGLPGKNQKIPDDVFPEIRRAEARYFPYHLKKTLEQTGQWGAVRVIPGDSVITDVYVSGEINKSNGDIVQVTLTARDVTGNKWIERRYSMRTDRAAYSRQRDRFLDPYQNVYNEFANDLFSFVSGMSDEEISEIRRTARMAFFADMAPSVFGDYIERGRRGGIEVVRLPAENDPMVDRLTAIRQRDALFLDTLNEHYANFYYGISLPYEDWRKSSREAQIEYQRIRRSAFLRGLAGVAIIAAASEISRGEAGDSGTVRRTRNTMKDFAIYGGLQAIQSGFGRLADARLQQQSISELADSFGQEAAPMVVEVQGQTRRLSGTAAAQYDQWRELLRQINEAETGLPDASDIGVPERAPEQLGDAEF